jgi:hypothetical protein
MIALHSCGMSVHSYNALKASRKPMVTRSVPGRYPQLVIGRLAHAGAKGPMGVRLADQSREPAIRSHESVHVRAIVEKPSTQAS